MFSQSNLKACILNAKAPLKEQLWKLGHDSWNQKSDKKRGITPKLPEFTQTPEVSTKILIVW